MKIKKKWKRREGMVTESQIKGIGRKKTEKLERKRTSK